MGRFFERSESKSPAHQSGNPAGHNADGQQPSCTAAAGPARPTGLSKSDRRRRAKRSAARRKSEERSLSNERLEPRIALSVNVAGYEDAVDFFVQAPDFQDQYGFRRAPHSPLHTVHGRAIVASDDGSDVYLRQVASVTQDLIVDTSSNFLNYKIIDDIDGRYQQLFVTNGTLRNEPNPLRPEPARPYDRNTANNWRSEFQLTDCEIVAGTVNGQIRYTQADGTVSTWNYNNALVLTGPGFGTNALPAGHIRPIAVGLLDNPTDIIGSDTQQSTMFVDWTDRPNPFNELRLDAFYVTGDEAAPLRAGFTRNTPATEATIEREDPTLGGTLYQVIQVVMPEALSTLQDGVTERQSLGIIPGSYRGEVGAITVTWSDGIARPLPAFRADVNGVLRFNTFLPAVGSGYTGSIYKDSSWYFTPETFGSGSTAGLVDVRGTIRTDGILELEFRKWERLDPDVVGFTDETGRGWNGFAYEFAEPLYAGPGPVVVQDVDYLTYTRDAEPNSVTFFAGQTISREVTVDLLAPGSTVNIDSPINVDPTIRSYFNEISADRLQLPDIDLRATNINVRAQMTAPDRVSMGRSQVSRERLSIPPDDVNPYLLSPSMPSLYDRDAPEPPILPNGGFPDIRQAAAIVEVNTRGQVSRLVLLPGYEGYGYDPENPPTVTIDLPPDAAGGGSSAGNLPATARALVGRDGRLTGFVITNPGTGYPTTLGNRPRVEISAPIPQAAATARVAEINAATGQVTRIEVLDPGYRYHAPPRVVVAPPDLTSFGVQATARAVLDPEGRLLRIEVVDPGRGYTQRPVVTIAAPSPIAMAERIIVEAEIQGDVYEIYVGDDFGTDVPRGLVQLSANGTLSIAPVPVQIASIFPTPTGLRPEDVNQQLQLQAPGGGLFPATFNPVGVILSGPGVRQGTRVLAWNAQSGTATVAPLSVSRSITFPLRVELSVRADSLYLEATTADVYLEGLVNVEQQSYLVHSPPSAAHLGPFTLTTRTSAAGIQSGELEGRVIDITLGNDSQTPLAGSTAEHIVDLRLAADSLRTRAGSSAVSPQGSYPYRLTISEEDTISVDAVAASSLPISISATRGITLTSAVDTDGDFSLNAQADDGGRATLRVTAPIRTRFGKVAIGADTVEIRNSLEVTSAAVVEGRQDVVIEARGGNLVLQGNISAPNNVVLEQVDRVDEIQLVATETVFPVTPGETVQRAVLRLPNGGDLPETFDPSGLSITAADPTQRQLILPGARIATWDAGTSTATLPLLYADALSQFYSETPLVNGGGVGTTNALVLPASTPLLGGGGTAIARVAANSAWIREAVVGDLVSFYDAAGNFLEAWQISRVNVATGEVTISSPLGFTAAATEIRYFQGTQWSRRVNNGDLLEFLDSQGNTLGTATVVNLNRDTGVIGMSGPVPIGAVSIRRPPTLQPIAATGNTVIQLVLSSPVRSVTFGEVDGNLARIVADELSIIADGKVAVGTDVNRLTATAGRGFRLSELNDVTIPLLVSGGLVSLEALGVDLGPKGQNPVALTASLIDVSELVVNTPNGSARIDVNTDTKLLVGDAVTIAKLGDRAPGMLAAGDVTIRSQSGDVVLLDAPVAGGNARAVRVATSAQLPATATYLPGVPGLAPSTLSGAGSLNAVGDRFWGTDANGRAIQLAVGDLVLVKDQGLVRTAAATVTAASASADGTRVTYTAANGFLVGQTVSIAGLSPSQSNLANVRVVAASPVQFTVETAGVFVPDITNVSGLASVPAATATVTAAVPGSGGTRVTYTGPNTFEAGQTISIVGLPRFNLENVKVLSATATQFTVETTGAFGPSVTNASGVAAVTRFAVSSPTVDAKRENGVYRVAALGGGAFGSQRWQLVRDAASDTAIDMPNGTLVRVLEGRYATQAFSITYDSIVPTLVERVGTNQLQFPAFFPNFDLLRIGQVVNGTGIAPDSFISAIDPVARVVTLDVVNPGQVFDSGLGLVDVVAASGDTITLGGFGDDQFKRLAVGQQVTGPGITAGAVIMRIDPTTRQIDIAKTLLGPATVAVAGNELTFDPRDTDAPFTQYSLLEVGQKVQLFDSEAVLLETRTITRIDAGDRAARRVMLDGPASPAAATARIWSPGAVAPVLSGTADPGAAQVPVGEVRPSSIVFRAANRLAGVRVGQLFRFVDAAGVPLAAVAPEPVASITIREDVNGNVEGDVTIGFNSLLTPAQLSAIRTVPGGAAVEFMAPDRVAFGVSAPRSVPVRWNEWTAANVFDGAVLLSSRYTAVAAVPGDDVSTRITAINPESVVVPTAEIDTGVATINISVVQPAADFFRSAVVGQMVQFLEAPGNADGNNAFVPPLPPVTAGLAGGVNTTVATMAPVGIAGPSLIFANLVVGQTVQFLAAATDAVLGTATVTSFTAGANILELSGTIPAGTVALRRLNVATITALDPVTGEITLSEPTPRNAAQVRLLPNTVPLLRGIGTANAFVAPYSPLFLWAEAGHTVEILDAAGTTILASLTISDLDPTAAVFADLDPVAGRIGLNGIIPPTAGLLRLGNLTTVQPNSAFFDLALEGDVVEFVDALGTVLPVLPVPLRITRLERDLGGVLFDGAVPARAARLRLPNVATVGGSSQFFAFAETGAEAGFQNTAGAGITAPVTTIVGLDSFSGTVRFDRAIPVHAAFVSVEVPGSIVVLATNSAFFDLAREGDEVEFADASGRIIPEMGVVTIRALNARLGEVEISRDFALPLSAADQAILGRIAQVRVKGGNTVNVTADSEFFNRAVAGNRVRFLSSAGGELEVGDEPVEAMITGVSQVLLDGTRDIRLSDLPPESFTTILSGVGTTTAMVQGNAPWFRFATVGEAVQFRNNAGTVIGSARIGSLDEASGAVGLASGVTVPDGAVQIDLVSASFTQLRVFSSVMTLANFADFTDLSVGVEVFGENLILPIQNEVELPVAVVAGNSLIDVRTQWNVAAARASANGTRVTYDLPSGEINRLAVGQKVSVSGLPRFNVSEARIVATTSTSFTVETFGAIGPAITMPGGVATMDYSDRAAVGDEVEFLKLADTGSVELDANEREVVLGRGRILAIYPDSDVSQPGYVLVEGDHGVYGAPDGIVMRTQTRGFTITAIDPVARTITTDLSPGGATRDIGFGIAPSAQYPAASTLRLDPEFTNYERLFEGQRVYGAGIAAGAEIVAIDRVAGTVVLTPGSVGSDRGPIRVTQRDRLRSGFYPESFDDWVELDHEFNDFVEIKVGQQAELRDTFGRLLRVVTVTGVDGRFRTVGLENGSLNGDGEPLGDDLIDRIHTIRFLAPTAVRFGVIEGVGSGISDFLLDPVGLTPITVAARPVTTNIGSDLALRKATFVASTDGRTNDATGSLGKMLGIYQQNDTRMTQVDVAVVDVSDYDRSLLLPGDPRLNDPRYDGAWVLRLDPLFSDYDRLEAVVEEGKVVYGTPRMFSAAARVLEVDETRREVVLAAGSLEDLAIEDLSRVTFVTLPAATTNPDQQQEFRFWSWMTGDIQLLQELPAIRKTITLDGALLSNDYAGAAGPDSPAPTPPNPRFSRLFIDGRRITRDRDGRLVTIGEEINGVEIIDAGADGSKVARLSVGGFQQGNGIKLDGTSHTIIETVDVGRTTSNSVTTRVSNVRGITITGRYLEVTRVDAGRLVIPDTDRVVFNTMAVGQKVRLLNAAGQVVSRGDATETDPAPQEFTIASLDASRYVITFVEALPNQSVAGNRPSLVELAVAENNTVLGSTVVGGLAAGIYVEAGATRTYVVGGSVGTGEMDNQVGIFVAGDTINPARPATRETFIGANAILPSQPLVFSAAFAAGSREITLPASVFNGSLLGLGLYFDNPRVTPPLTEGDTLEDRPRIVGVDSARGVAILSQPATFSTSTGFKLGHVFERVNDGLGEYQTLRLPASIPLDEIYVGQTVTGTGLAPRGVQITWIDRDARTIRISEPFTAPGFGLMSISAPGQTVVRGNRTGILLRGEDARVTNAGVFENTRSGIEVWEASQQIGSTAAFGQANVAAPAAGQTAVPLASWPASVTLRSSNNVISLPSTFSARPTDIPIGTPVYGPGIPAGATVAALTTSTATGRITAVTLTAASGKPLATQVIGVAANTALVAANSWWFSEVKAGQQVQFRNASGANLGSPLQVVGVDPASGTVTLAVGAVVPAGAAEIAIAASRTALIGFGVSGPLGATVAIAEEDRATLFVGQDVHGLGLPEYTQIAGLRLVGENDYIVVTAPVATLAAPNFAALSGDVVFAERTSSSNRIYGNGEYGILVRHQDTGPNSTGGKSGLRTRIFANYFGLTGETVEVAPNRIAPIWYTYEFTSPAGTTAIASGAGSTLIQLNSDAATWIQAAEVGQEVQLLSRSGALLGTRKIVALDASTQQVTLDAAAPSGSTQIRKASRMPTRHSVSGRVSRVDLLGNKFGQGTVVLPPSSPINPIPPGDPIV